MHKQFRIFRFVGADVVVSGWSLAMYLFIGIWFARNSQQMSFPVAAGFVAVIVLSVLLHELAHGLAARAFGFQVLLIQLTAFGGSTRFRTSRPASLPMVLIAYAGPATNAIIGALAWFARDWMVTAAAAPGPVLGSNPVVNPVLYAFLTVTAYINLLLAALNAFPGRPFDGGALVEFIAAKFTSNLTSARRIACYPTIVGGAAILIYYFVLASQGQAQRHLWLGLAGIIFLASAGTELASMRRRPQPPGPIPQLFENPPGDSGGPREPNGNRPAQ